MSYVTVACDRCIKEVRGLQTPEFTAGFYRVAKAPWVKYAKRGEVIVCDACMHLDPKFRADYPDLSMDGS